MSKQLPYGMTAQLTSGVLPERVESARAEKAFLASVVATATGPGGDIALRWLFGKVLLEAREIGNGISDKDRSRIIRRCLLIEAVRQSMFSRPKHPKAEGKPRTVRPKTAGYLYLIEFRSGLIKAGRAGNPTQRVASHTNLARAHGDTVVRTWVSEIHECAIRSEAILLRWCVSRAEPVSGREYFRNLSFDEAVLFAASIPTDQSP